MRSPACSTFEAKDREQGAEFVRHLGGVFAHVRIGMIHAAQQFVDVLFQTAKFGVRLRQGDPAGQVGARIVCNCSFRWAIGRSDLWDKANPMKWRPCQR